MTMHPMLLRRLKAIREALVAAHLDGGPSAISGHVREQTFRQLLLPSIPPQYRISTGQIIDQYGNSSGQLDAIVENGHFPSLGAPSIADVRMVLAEGVSCVFEVKSTLPDQWKEVLATRDKVMPLRRKFRENNRSIGVVSERVPLFVVAYDGWKTLETVREKAQEPGITGVLILGPHPFFAGRIYDQEASGTEENAIWAFLCAVHFYACQVVDGRCDLFAYGRLGADL